MKKGDSSKTKQFRRRKDSDSDEDETREEIKARQALAGIREEHKLRKKNTGLVVDEDSQFRDTTAEIKVKFKKDKFAADVDDEEGYGLQDPKKQKQSIGNLMENNFTGQTDFNGEGNTLHDKRLETFLNEKLGIQKEDEEKKNEKPLTDLQKLYKLAQQDKERENALKHRDELGAPIAWNTGIAEVALPIEERLRNIERTEEAKQKLFEGYNGDGGRSKHGKSNAPVVGNVTVNFNKHRREYAQDKRLQRMGASEQQKPDNTQGQQQQQQNQGMRNISNDDAVFDRYRKRQRYRR